jgi:hypothetical protein
MMRELWLLSKKETRSIATVATVAEWFYLKSTLADTNSFWIEINDLTIRGAIAVDLTQASSFCSIVIDDFILSLLYQVRLSAS